MNREQLIEKVSAVVAAYGCRTDTDMEEDILDAVLPQIETASELEALPQGCIVVSHNGYPFERAWGSGADPETAPESMSVGGEPAGSCAQIIGQFGPLTVVWQPEVTS